MPAARARRRWGSIGASVFHGAVIRSPLPAWQWQSMIIAATVSRFCSRRHRQGFPSPSIDVTNQMFSRADRGQEPDARRDPVVKIREVKFFVWRVDPIIG